MNGKTTRAYGERLADQMAYLNRLVQETSGHQRGIGCYVARHNRRVGHTHFPAARRLRNAPNASKEIIEMDSAACISKVY